MVIQKKLLLFIFLFCSLQSIHTISLVEQFQQVGYVEMSDQEHGSATFDLLYLYFDELIEFLQTNPVWARKLYHAKERFIRSKDKHYYATDFFGFYDESQRKLRGQIAFYYSVHFHEFISSFYPEINQISQIANLVTGKPLV